MFQFFRLDRGGGNVGLHPPKMRSCAVLTSRSWLADVWDRTEEGATAEVTGNWGTTKNTSNIKKIYYEKHRMWFEWTLSLFLTLVFAWAFCLLKRLSKQQQHKQEWPTGHLYITSIWQQSSLQTDGQCVGCSRQQTCYFCSTIKPAVAFLDLCFCAIYQMLGH